MNEAQQAFDKLKEVILQKSIKVFIPKREVIVKIDVLDYTLGVRLYQI